MEVLGHLQCVILNSGESQVPGSGTVGETLLPPKGALTRGQSSPIWATGLKRVRAHEDEGA